LSTVVTEVDRFPPTPFSNFTAFSCTSSLLIKNQILSNFFYMISWVDHLWLFHTPCRRPAVRSKDIFYNWHKSLQFFRVMDINALAVERLEVDLNEMALATMLAIL